MVVTDSTSTFITRVVLKNYKSIAACDVELGPLMFLVGPNGSGKSNFLDALRFVADALSTSLDHAIRVRGGVREILCRSHRRTREFGIRLDFRLGEHAAGYYAFLIRVLNNEAYDVKEEECMIEGTIDDLDPTASMFGPQTDHRSLQVKKRAIKVDGEILGPAPGDRLSLPLTIRPEFWHLDRRLALMTFYGLQPDRIRSRAGGGADAHLMVDGLNASGILKRLRRDSPDISARIDEYLAQIVPGLHGVTTRVVGDDEMLEFQQSVTGAERPRRFPATSMSDGTMRALGILLALFQTEPNEHLLTPPLVGIEEPESALHPAGAEVLFDALREASGNRQVLVTSHSPDLLGNKDIDTDSILAVVSEDGETRIGPIEEVGRSALRDHLYTVGELLRMDQLRPAIPGGKTALQVRLFSDGAT
jgi:predicted ATPase